MADDAAAPEGELSEGAIPASDGISESPVETDDDAAEGEATDSEATEGEATENDDVEDIDGFDEEAEFAALGDPAAAGSHLKLATIIGLVVVVALAGLVGWLGYRAYGSQKADQQRELFLQVGRQGALNLTTIDFEHADADVQRILDSATDTFYDDFSKRSQPFVDVVKQAQSRSEGTVTSAGLESEDGDEGQVLVAVTVKTSNAGAAEQQPRAWRMRIIVKKTGADEAKVANVEFVP